MAIKAAKAPTSLINFELSVFTFELLLCPTVLPITPQDEGAGSKQGGYKDRKVDGEEQEDKESGKEANFYFPGLTPFFHFGIMKEYLA